MSRPFRHRKWVYDPPPGDVVDRLRRGLGLPPPLAEILAGRGIAGPQEARAFLYPSLETLPQPLLLKGMKAAVSILARAVRQGRFILVYGDYDVDGVTATALLLRFFKRIGARAGFCQPRRFEHGYGLSADLVRQAGAGHGEGRVVLTVDCGISDHAEVAALRRQGWRVIVTDHHQPPATLPEADAVIDPWQEGCSFPCKNLAGVGVAFYLLMALRRALAEDGFWNGGGPPRLKPFMDMVAIGTLCDMVPLHGVNRLLVKAGLDAMNEGEPSGLDALLRQAGLNRGHVTSEDITFQIGPRLNAAGRLKSAELATRLLTAPDLAAGLGLAREIDSLNQERKRLTEQVAREALAVARRKLDEGPVPCLVLHGRDWHQGVIGIAASRVVESCHVPVIILSGRGLVRGSARSVPGVDIHGLIRVASEYLVAYGGHNSAAGLSIYEENIICFEEMIRRAAAACGTLSAVDDLHIDCLIPPRERRGLAEYARINQLLAPFGQNNPEPVYAASHRCPLRNIRQLGKSGEHFSCQVSIAGAWHRAVGFHMGHRLDDIRRRMAFNELAFTVSFHHYHGHTSLQVQIVDFKL